MFFASDNSGPAHPSVMAALARAGEGYAMGYGADDVTKAAVEAIRATFDAPDAAVYFLPTGTAANALALATLTPPYATVFCADIAHIQEDECNAPEFYSGGAKLTLVPTQGGKISPAALAQKISGEENRGVHGPARGPVSLTNATELGTLYTPAEVAALSDVAKTFGLPVHLDGARLANALIATKASPAEMTWRAGVDVLSFGGTKNGLMGAEAVVFFDPAQAEGFEYRRKRGGHLFSKHRYLAAQMLAYLQDDLWLDLAARANRANTALSGVLSNAGAEIAYPPEANSTFARLPRRTHKRLFDAGALYHLWGDSLEGEDDSAPLLARFVCDWSLRDETLARFTALL